MEMLARCKCPECDGYKTRPNLQWQRFYQIELTMQKDLGRPLNGEEYDRTVLGFFGATDLTRLPSEETECDYCKGKGTVEEWIDLEELTSRINILNRP